MLRIKMAEKRGMEHFGFTTTLLKKITFYKSYLQFFLPWRVEILQMATINF